ncbi:CpaF family protein [Proteiniclasticum ruminis]|uniref:Pilus assembly protein CpaF n=1 Tax=Proteiniclasticum ruminis TaxID=398199 RepID=A0A1I5D6X2_9CLOT|nr:CpaF family protein [Proteiniclasticum ruminis]SFN95014.1 pilus assembly protein CpaF [Proteiniclasticum ruminis]
MMLNSFGLNNQDAKKDQQEEQSEKKKKEIEEFSTLVLEAVIDDVVMNPDSKLEEQEKIIKEQIGASINDLSTRHRKHWLISDKQKITKYVMDEVFGYGPVTSYLHDPSVTEVMVNGPNHVYIERFGKIEPTTVTFRNDQHVLHTIDKIIAPLGRRVDESSPMVDARLPDGSRVNIIIPPLAIKGPTITIRKFSTDPFTLEDLITFGTLNMDMAKFLRASVRGRCNVIVSGGTGSGKTTLLNVISSFIPHDERIITVEDAAELQLQQEHVLTLESRPANIEGKGKVTIRDLVVNTLRMRPDRIVVGEVRSAEALDMLQAMNTGHDGSLTTIHANTPRDTLSRLETMVMMAGMELPSKAIREQIASALDLIVQVSRFNDGSRKITKVSEVVGMENDTITLQDIFVFRQEGFDETGKVMGKHVATGIVPKFIEKLKTYGENVPSAIFKKYEMPPDPSQMRR